MLSNFTKASLSFRSLGWISRSLTQRNLKPKLDESQNFSRNFDKKGMLNDLKELTIQDEKNKILNLSTLPGPPILTTLITRNEAKIHLVGVGHYTKKSQEDVSNVIRQTQPNFVFVELCKNRRHHLTNPKTAVNEMHTAFIEAQKIPGCQLHLGDRHLWITLMRVLTYSSSLSKSISFIFSIFSDKKLQLDLPKVERHLKELQKAERHLHRRQSGLKSGDAQSHTYNSSGRGRKSGAHMYIISGWGRKSGGASSPPAPHRLAPLDIWKKWGKKEQYIKIMTGDIEKVICEERDTYMAYELQKITKNCIEDVNGSPKPPVVVAVVGLAHVDGILEKIDKITDQDVAEITQVPPVYASIVMMKIGFFIFYPFLFIFQILFGNL